MSSFLPNHVLKEVRIRRQMARMAMQSFMSFRGMEEDTILSQLTIMRAEKGRQNIRVNNFSNLMGTLGMPVDAFFCPCMENQTSELLQMLDTLTNYAAGAKENAVFLQKGLDLLSNMKADANFAEGVNKQHLISQEVVLLEALGKDPEEIRRLIQQGLEITYPELAKDPFDGDMLIFEEGPLLHSLARTYLQEGNTAYAIALLKDIFEGLTLLPQDDKEKERMLAPMLLTLVQCCIQEKDYAEALNVCDAGHKISLKRNNGYFVPDFTEFKIYCLHMLRKKDELPALTLQTLAGYLLLRRYTKADSLLQYAKEHKIAINTHGMETVRPAMPEPVFAYGKTIPCDSIGGFIAGLRYDADLKLKDLCEGLCVESTLNKIERAHMPLDKVYLLEALMQRLGRHIDHYFDTFISMEDFENKQLRDEINSLLVSRDYKEAEELLAKLAKKKSFQSGINLQFVELAKASIYNGYNKYDAKHLAMLHKVLGITRKEFDIGLVNRTRLTYYDITAINQMANNLCSTGSMREGLRLFEDLIESMDRYYVDEHEKIRTYTTVRNNYATFMWRADRFKESLDVAITVGEMDVKHGRLRTLPGSTINRACSMHSMGDKENCLPYFALGYYGSRIVGRQVNARTVKNYVKKHLGIGF